LLVPFDAVSWKLKGTFIVGSTSEPQILRLTQEEFQRQITELEQRYQMPSAEFLRRYDAGDLGDDLSLIHWAGLLRVAAKAGFHDPLPA
jgi:hypothetical protein